MKRPRLRPPVRALLESAGLALVMVLAFRFPARSGLGGLEAAAALLFPTLLFAALARGRRAGWIYLALALGLGCIFYWVPATIAAKAPMPYPLALAATGLFLAWEALGFLAVALAGRWALGRGGPLAAAGTTGLGLALWEICGFHVYTWSWGAPLGGLPFLARSAAFVDSHGLAALLWACGAWTGATWAARRPRRALAGPALLLLLLAALGGLWRALPRGPARILDVVMIQPDFPAGVVRPGMETEMWARSDAALQRLDLPRPDAATLLLWPESSVLGRDDLRPNPRLNLEARRRGVIWMYGTEGGDLGQYNLVRGELAGQPSFLQAKVDPMPFGERMPGPPAVRHWLDRLMGFVSQEPGRLTPASSFRVPTPQGPLAIHPLLCSEALDTGRARDGLRLAGADLLTNHTNDGWFERSPATDLHAAQIRLRAVETGLPLLRATLTGRSGIFRADGTWELWGAPMTAADYGFRLQWRPVSTPARSPWALRGLLAILALAALAGLRRPR